eukprot:6182276-Pleurochrysis_carterae.AAC.2
MRPAASLSQRTCALFTNTRAACLRADASWPRRRGAWLVLGAVSLRTASAHHDSAVVGANLRYMACSPNTRRRVRAPCSAFRGSQSESKRTKSV